MVFGGGVFFLGLIGFLQINVYRVAEDAEVLKPSAAAATKAENGQPKLREAKPVSPVSNEGQNVGVLTPAPEILFSATGGSLAFIQIGKSQVVLGPEGIPGVNPIEQDDIGRLLIPGIEASDLKVEMIEGRIKVSTKVPNESGALVAEIIRNEWQVAKQPASWDRNYNDNALEVKDEKGRIVLQIIVYEDRILLQGVWKTESQAQTQGLTRVVIREAPSDRTQATFQFWNIRAPNYSDQPTEIKPIFKYPSAPHLGELVEMPKSTFEAFQRNFSDLAFVSNQYIPARFDDQKGHWAEGGSSLYRNWLSRTISMGFYIASSPFAYDAIALLAPRYTDAFANVRRTFVGKVKFGVTEVKQEQLTPSNIVYVFHEDALSAEQMARLIGIFRGSGLVLRLRGAIVPSDEVTSR
jgi:hypothetical protein